MRSRVRTRPEVRELPAGFLRKGEPQGAGGDKGKNERGEEHGGGCYLMRLRISSISFLVSC